jgi:hypothetical protein
MALRGEGSVKNDTFRSAWDQIPYWELVTAGTNGKPQPPREGDLVEITVLGRVKRDVGWMVGRKASTGRPVHLDDTCEITEVTSVRVVRAAPPKWRAGDVVVVRFHPLGGGEYTYVRGVADWPGDTVRKLDEEINKLWDQGLVRHAMRDGKNVPAAS